MTRVGKGGMLKLGKIRINEEKKKMLQVGFARVDITPTLGSPLAGYGTHRPAKTVLDPLELNAIAFSDGENKAVLISCDLIYVMEEPATRIRQLIFETCGISADHIFIHGLHQHTSVRIGSRPCHLEEGIVDDAYLSVLFRKFCDVTALALSDLAPATATAGEKEAPEKFSFIRRYRMKNGTVRTNPGIANPDAIGPVGEADNTVRLVKFIREGKDDIALVHFSTHSDVIAGNGISADWPGFIRRTTEKEMEGVRCVALCGPQGDTNHVDVMGNFRTGYGHSAYMGKVIAKTALSMWDDLKALAPDKVWGRVEMKYIPTNTLGLEKLDEYQKMQEDIDAGKLNISRDMGLQAQLERVLSLPEETLYQKVPVSVLCLGDLCFAGFGGEAFTQYGRDMKKAFPETFVLSLCLTNGGQGYLPTKEAFEEGGYEASSSRFSPETQEILTGSAIEMIKEYLAK